MFKFLDLFKKKPTSIPSIKATQQHKKDDKRQHEIFLTELEDLLNFSNLFKPKYINKYKNLYKNYMEFTGKDPSLIYKQPYLIESLTEEAQNLNKNELNKYLKNIVLLASRRAATEVKLNRFESDNLFKEVTLIFPKNDLICKKVLEQKKLLNKKSVLISKAPIYPLKTCITCPSCYLGITYKPNIKL